MIDAPKKKAHVRLNERDRNTVNYTAHEGESKDLQMIKNIVQVTLNVLIK